MKLNLEVSRLGEEGVLSKSVPDGRWEIRGPTEGSPVVEAWAQNYISLGDRRAGQKELLEKIRNRCKELKPRAGEVLHATFFGVKRTDTDVENLLLFNIGTFKGAGRHGVRFEHGADAPLSPSGTDYPYCYRYALVPRSGTFADWRHGRQLASFDWTDLGTFPAKKRLAQVWLALAHGYLAGEVEPVFPSTPPEIAFAVKVEVRPAYGSKPGWGGLVKSIFDGVICAFQAHTDRSVLPVVLPRLAGYLPATPAELEHHLLDQSRAVLRPVHRLVAPYQLDVKWYPSDEQCLAGELLGSVDVRIAGEVFATEPVDSRWAIKGQIVELLRRGNVSSAGSAGG